MRKKNKYQRRNQKTRDCTKCKNFKGFISKNYFACATEMFEDQLYPKCHDIYDKDILKKGTCILFVPIEERDQDDSVHVNNAVERTKQKNDKSLSDKE